jgi:hypothetical protein
VKWIGNAGSHSDILTPDDTLDGYERMDWVLDSLYARRHRSASTLTRTINHRRVPSHGGAVCQPTCLANRFSKQVSCGGGMRPTLMTSPASSPA